MNETMLEQIEQCNQKYNEIVKIKSDMLSDELAKIAPRVAELFRILKKMNENPKFQSIKPLDNTGMFSIEVCSDNNNITLLLILPFNICIDEEGGIYAIADETTVPGQYVMGGCDDVIKSIVNDDDKIASVKASIKSVTAYIDDIYIKINDVINSINKDYETITAGPTPEEHDLLIENESEAAFETLIPDEAVESDTSLQSCNDDIGDNKSKNIKLSIPVSQIIDFRKNRCKSYYEISFPIPNSFNKKINASFIINAHCCSVVSPDRVVITLMSDDRYRVYSSAGETVIMTGQKLYKYYEMCNGSAK